MDEKLTFADGTEYNGHAIESGDVLWIYIHNESLQKCYPILSNAEKTETICSFYFGDKTNYVGYNYLFCIKEETKTYLTAGLRKE